MEIKEKSPSLSAVEMREIVMPQHANPLNTVFGGVVMSWIDIAAAMAASRHCQRPVVTAHVDDISFISPIKVGEHVLIKASLNYVGTTSMLVGVKVESDNPYTCLRQTTTRAYLTFVALDDQGKPTQVPNLIVSTNEERRRFENGQKRIKALRTLRKKLSSETNQ
jgi:acyl-CoA hydrolase